MRKIFHSLKMEGIHGKRVASQEITRSTVFNYIGRDYDRLRHHSTCGALSLEQFKNQNFT
ncbi:IS3 family transposase [Dickeya oryzae]|nr:IS3 family transposase [Dickeya oryzae]